MALALDDPPELGMNQLPALESYEAGHLWDLLEGLRTYTIEFEAAVRIMEHCVATLRATDSHIDLNEYWLWSHARSVPARDAAMSVYHFGCTILTSIPSALRRCPTISAVADHPQLKSVRRDFKERMANYTLLRHAVSHRAEMVETPTKKQAHAAQVRHGRQKEIVLGNLNDQTLVFTIDGQWASLQITNETLNSLADFTLRTFSALPQSLPAGD